MDDLISRAALLEFAHNHVNGTVDCNDIARFPAVDAEPVRLRIDTAEIDAEKGWYEKLFYCRCGQLIKTEMWNEKYCFGSGTVLKTNVLPKNCPNCGAKMDRGANDD